MQGKKKRPDRKSFDFDSPAAKPLDAEDRHLSAREYKFVQLYLTGKSKAEAIREAGSKAKDATQSGWEMANRPNVKKAISEGMAGGIKKSGLHSSEIINVLRTNIEMAQAKGDIKAANDAAKILGQHLEGFFKTPDKSDEDKSGKGVKDISDASKVLGTSDEPEDIRSDTKRFLDMSRSFAAGRENFDIKKTKN